MKLFHLPEWPDDPEELEHQVNQMEREAGTIKESAEARIVWANPESKSRTEYSLLYLHGFTASQGEGEPCHINLAKRYGLNLYLGRLEGHGLLTKEPLKGLKSRHLVRSALNAFAISKKLGKQVIIMGTSTGASLGLLLASRFSSESIKGLILYSPLIDFYGIKSTLLTHSITRKLLRFVPGRGFKVSSPLPSVPLQKIWYHNYRLEGALALGKFVQFYMVPDTFQRIEVPAYVGYYYKNRKEQDKIVSVSAIKKMYRLLKTDTEFKKIQNFPDADSHVICSKYASKEFKNVEKATFEFTDNVLGLNPL